MHIGFIGGGNLARNLATLCNGAGHEVTVGVRDPATYKPAALYRVSSVTAASGADLIVLALPFAACKDALPPLAGALAGKIVVDATNPLKPDWTPLFLGEENSAAETIMRLLPASHLVKAFNMVFADVMTPERLMRGERAATVFVAGDNAAAREAVRNLARGLGFDARDAGLLRNSRYLEAMAHLNIQLAVTLGGGTNAAFLYDQC
jgi:predicted dinucleotide-binding enzyme